MQIHNNEITVYRNETFSMNKIIQNRDGSPYIVSSKLNNPYFLITVSDSVYKQINRYAHNKWLNLRNELRFEITRPVNIKELGYSSFDGMRVPAGFEGDNVSYANVAVFTDGISYKYWSYGDDAWKDYSLKINTVYSSEVTSRWPEGTLHYGILLVDGPLTEDYLKVTCEQLNLDATVSPGEMFNSIQNVRPDLVAHIEEPGRPIIKFNEVRQILEPTKLYVKSNLKGGMI